MYGMNVETRTKNNDRSTLSLSLVTMSLVSLYTSHVTRHTSHVTRHTSHVTRHTSQHCRLALELADELVHVLDFAARLAHWRVLHARDVQVGLNVHLEV